MYFDEDDHPQSSYDSPSMQAALGLFLPKEETESEPETVIVFRQIPSASGSPSTAPNLPSPPVQSASAKKKINLRKFLPFLRKRND